MKPSVLIDVASIAQEVTAVFHVERPHMPVTVFQSGLGAGESIALEILVKETSDGTQTWAAVKEGGDVVALDPGNTVVRLDQPGVYRLKCASAAGPVIAGIY